MCDYIIIQYIIIKSYIVHIDSYLYVTHVGCECGSVSHVSQNKTQFIYNVYYKLNDAIHTNTVQLFTHSSMRELYNHTIISSNIPVPHVVYKSIGFWRFEQRNFRCFTLASPTPTAWHWPEQNTHHHSSAAPRGHPDHP